MASTIDSATSSAGTGGLQTTPTGSRTLGKNEFLKLLTTQLANQDPLSPTDNQAFIAQLAQFASVEQQETANSRLDAILMAQAANNQTAVAGLVGKDIVFKTDSATLDASGNPVHVGGELSANASVANAIIFDENGKKVRTLQLTDVKAGQVDFTWDGKNDAGEALPPGNYKVQLTAADEHGTKIDITQRGRGRANGVSFEDGVPTLVVDGRKIKMSDVLQIAEPSPTTTDSETNKRFTNLFTTLNRS
ncbi:MAG: flagellar hook capping FlgD N-terminal domain-containing protein [Archangium sp.]